MAYRILRSIAIASMGVFLSWGVIEIVGPSDLIEHLVKRWRVPLYEPILLSVLILILTSYFHFKKSKGTWVKEIATGIAFGSVAGLVSVVAAAWLETGLQSILGGLSAFGIQYLLLLFGTAMVPFVSWLYGAIATLGGGLIERHLICNLERRLTSSIRDSRH